MMLLREISYMGNPTEGKEMMLTGGVKIYPGTGDDLVLVVRQSELTTENPLWCLMITLSHLPPGSQDPHRSLSKPLALRIFTHPLEEVLNQMGGVV